MSDATPQPPSPPEDPYQPPEAATQSQLPFRDQKGLILAMGILAIIAGLGFGCLGGFYGFAFPLIMEQMPEEEQVSMPFESDSMKSLMASTGGMMALLAAALIWIGVGAIRVRKWAGDLSLAMNWLYGGIMLISMISTIFFLPQMLAGMQAQMGESAVELESAQTVNIVMGVSLVISFAMYLVPPLMVILVFRMKNVQRTFEHYDQGRSWTNGIALPALMWWVLMATAFVGMVAMAPGIGPLYQMMGLVEEGWHAAVGLLGFALLAGAGAWGILKRQSWSWYVCLVWVLVASGVGWMVTQKMDLLQMYREMGMSEEELKMMEAMYGDGSIYTMPMLISLVAMIVFLALSKRYFRFEPNSSPV